MKTKLYVRDSMTTINGNDDKIEMPSHGMEILANDGNALFSVYIRDDGGIEISTGVSCVKHCGKILDGAVIVQPMSANRVVVYRAPYA